MPLAAYFAKKHAENQQYGYRVDYKFLAIAFAIEIIVVYTSLHGALLFARTYARDADAFTMMMLAPIAYAGVELSRVPLAFSLRTQTSRWWKTLFALLVLCAAAVTVKSLSQLGEIMFRPRLTEVTESTIALRDAQNRQATALAAIRDADAVVEQRRAVLQTNEECLRLASTAVTGLPKEQCWWATRRTQAGATRARQCKTDGRQAPLLTALKDAQVARDKAAEQLDAANAARARLNADESNGAVAAAEVTQRKAVMNSQLHSFTAMFFGKEPTQVTDGEIHFFLRWFIFFPAIFASLAATGLALASVTYPREPAPAAVEIDEAVLRSYVLEPLVGEVSRRLQEEADIATARTAAAAAATMSNGAPVEEAGPAPASVNDNPYASEAPPRKAAV